MAETIPFVRPDVCPACGGTGATPDGQLTCEECDGDGRVIRRAAGVMFLATQGESVIDSGPDAAELIAAILRTFDLAEEDVVVWRDGEDEEAPRVAALLRNGEATWL